MSKKYDCTKYQRLYNFLSKKGREDCTSIENYLITEVLKIQDYYDFLNNEIILQQVNNSDIINVVRDRLIQYEVSFEDVLLKYLEGENDIVKAWENFAENDNDTLLMHGIASGDYGDKPREFLNTLVTRERKYNLPLNPVSTGFSDEDFRIINKFFPIAKNFYRTKKIPINPVEINDLSTEKIKALIEKIQAYRDSAYDTAQQYNDSRKDSFKIAIVDDFYMMQLEEVQITFEKEIKRRNENNQKEL